MASWDATVKILDAKTGDERFPSLHFEYRLRIVSFRIGDLIKPEFGWWVEGSLGSSILENARRI